MPVIVLFAIISSCRKSDFANITAAGSVLNARTNSQPNIILILGDDVGYDIPNYTGGQSYSTPNLNYLAANGMQFTQCHTTPLCSPSRVMLMTGKYNFRNYVTWGIMDTTQRTIANVLENAGYATCVVGKWQFDGSDASIRKFGFQNYLVTNHRKKTLEDPKDIYKNPMVYENGALWPTDSVKGKYGEDLFRDYMFKFIDSSKDQKPFFIYWAPNLVHPPFSPTPDDPQFATWNPSKKANLADTMYYPSMVQYMDKLIGQLIDKLNTDGLANNTLVLFTGDNGTINGKFSLWNGQVVEGGKSTSTEAGTHVPLLAYMPGTILPGSTDTSLISLVDFMATISDAAGTTIPPLYNAIDGTSFYGQLQGSPASLRSSIFCHFVGSGKFETNPTHLRRWMQDHTYKQYDSLPSTKYSKKFYNIKLDPFEQNPIKNNKMTEQEKALSKQYLDNMKLLR